MPNFEEYERGTSPITEPLITIQKSRVVTFNRAAFQVMGTFYFRPVYDRKEKIIGLRPCAEDDSNAYQIRIGSTGVYTVGLQGFLSHFGINTDLTRRYEAVKDGDLVLIDLKKPVKELSGRESTANGKPAS